MNLATRDALLHVLRLIEEDERKLAVRREMLTAELDQIEGQLAGIATRRTEIEADLQSL